MAVSEGLSEIGLTVRTRDSVSLTGQNDLLISSADPIYSSVHATVLDEAPTGSAFVFGNKADVRGDGGDNEIRGVIFAMASRANFARANNNEVTLSGEDGDDLIEYSVNGLSDPGHFPQNKRAHVNNNTINLNGGDGQDQVWLHTINNGAAIYKNTIILDGGDGDDLLGVRLTAEFVATNTVEIRGGDGADVARLDVFDHEDVVVDFSKTYDQTISNVKLTGIESVEVWAGWGNDRLTGGSGADVLSGGMGNDRIDGGEGADIMYGGMGDDTFVVDHVDDYIEEYANWGTDRVLARVSFTLGDNIENLQLTTSAALSGTGNSLANTITGNNGNNVLKGMGGADILLGGGGDDILIGGKGKDTLTGGAGSDTFLFTAGDSNSGGGARDVITDFEAGIDKIDISALGIASFADLTFKTVFGGLIVYADANGDGAYDFGAQLTGISSLNSEDFIL